MTYLCRLFLAVVFGSFMLVGCHGGGGGGGSSGSSSSDTDSSGGGEGGIVINGTASAPGGMIAQSPVQSVLKFAIGLIVTPAYAEVTGLQPVAGATVELIRVDDAGVQIGAVLATTVTSITGNYTLTLPQGVSLAGNLIVRITGHAGVEMRAQVVDVAVDISPVSEFVLQKFIDHGADLDNLVVADVVKLKGRVAEFDLTAEADLTAMLAKLESELGDFVDNSVSAVIAAPGDASTISGAYRAGGLWLAMHDGDNDLYSSVWLSVAITNGLTIADAGNGVPTITGGTEEDFDLRLSGTESGASIYSDAEIDDEGWQPASVLFSSEDNGILTLTGDFEEEIQIYSNDCCGWRSPSGTYRLQKVKDRGLFFLASEDASVRYGLVDTNNDGLLDAVNPSDRSGDEVERSLEVIARKPTAMTQGDLQGNFGRVWFGANLSSASRGIELETEANIVTFNGNGTLDDSGVALQRRLSRSGYSSTSVAAEAGIPITTTADGDITSVDGENVDAFINDTFDFIVFVGGVSNIDGNQVGTGSTDTTLMMKLGAGTPVVTGNTYRKLSLGMKLSGTQIALINSRFESILTMNSQSAGALSQKRSVVSIANLGANVAVDNTTMEGLTVTANVSNQGVATLTINEGNGTETLEGYFNADGSLGIFRSTHTPTSANPDALGLVVLIKTN